MHIKLDRKTGVNSDTHSYIKCPLFSNLYCATSIYTAGCIYFNIMRKFALLK